MESLIQHSHQFFKPSTTSAIPSLKVQAKILYIAEKAYQPVRWELPDDFDQRVAFDRAVRRLNMSSSPGYPYLREATTNSQWLEFNGIECSAIKLDRLWHDVCCVRDGTYEQILRVFVKSEPHKQEKADANRWRLIMATPLCVQVWWHMLFDYMNDLEIEKAYEIPSQQGLVMVSGGWKLYRQQWLERGYNVGLDKRAWDWTVPKWVLDLDLELRRRTGYGSRMDRWYEYASRAYDDMFTNPLILLSNGMLFRQIFPGIVKTGGVNTISTNSHGQVIVHVPACILQQVSCYPLPAACGDDTLQVKEQTADLEAYRSMGVVIKTASEGLEFVGHDFKASGPHPLYFVKHLKRVQFTPDDILPQYLDSMARMYCHTELFEFWQQLALDLGCPLPLSLEAYLYWYDVGE